MTVLLEIMGTGVIAFVVILVYAGIEEIVSRRGKKEDE